MECKSGIVTSVSSGSESVLIETLWNVNSPLIVVLGDSDHCINRNIVECKLNRNRELEGQKPVLIETLWNVNDTDEAFEMVDDMY